MENTYNYLKTAFQNLKKEISQNPFPILICLVLWSIPFPYAFGSAALILLLLTALFNFKKSSFKIDKTLLLPIVLFLLMSISLIWSRDIHSSVRALSKGLPLLIIPLSFFILPDLAKKDKQKIIRWYSYGILAFTFFCFLKAIFRFFITQNSAVFFYHELVTEDVNAIHVSVYVAIAVFYFITKSDKIVFDKIGILVLSLFLILLSSKNILIVFLGLVVFYYFKYYKSSLKSKYFKILALLFILVSITFIGKIKNRFLIEYQTLTTENSLNYEIGNDTEKVYNVSVKQAWTQDKFKPNDYFAGFPFRVYQIRIFIEMLQEDAIFFTGYGLNASDFKVEEKRQQYNLYSEYGEKNFHNEYIQIFAELGIIGFLILIVMLFRNIKNALQSKDFIHISFAVLMISLFLTESFLSRQRGIIFFTMMFCLFNSRIFEKEQIILNKD